MTSVQVCLSNLEKAAALYRGDFFEGFNLKDCPEFDEWQFFQRESLRSKYAGTLEKLAAQYASSCDWEKAILHTRSWLALDRLHEPAQRMLMRNYLLSGQRSAALRQYEECERLLEQELGQPPEPETLKIYEEIRAALQLESRRDNGRTLSSFGPSCAGLSSGRASSLDRSSRHESQRGFISR